MTPVQVGGRGGTLAWKERSFSTQVRVFTFMCVHMHACVFTFMCVHMYVCGPISARVSACFCGCVCEYTCVSACVCACR